MHSLMSREKKANEVNYLYILNYIRSSVPTGILKKDWNLRNASSIVSPDRSISCAQHLGTQAKYIR